MKLNIDYLLLNIVKKTGWHGQKGAIATVAIRHRRGFTLIEALIAMLLLGFAISGLIVANQTFTKANGAGLELSTAEFLIEQIREQTVTMPFGTLVSTYNSSVQTYSPPHDSKGVPLDDYPAYSQRITGQYVNASDLRTPSGSGTHFYRVTVEIRLNSETLSSASWLRANY